MFKKLFLVTVLAVTSILAGCQRDAQVASKNLSYAADNFQMEC